MSNDVAMLILLIYLGAMAVVLAKLRHIEDTLDELAGKDKDENKLKPRP